MPGKNAGDLSIVEAAKADITVGNKVLVWSDDLKFWQHQPNLSELPRGFGAVNVEITAGVVGSTVANGHMTIDQYKATVESFQQKVDPFNPR